MANAPAPNVAAVRGTAVASPTSLPTLDYPPTQHPGPLRHAEPVMGTVFSFAISDAGQGARREAIINGLQAAIARLHRIDEVFSTYRDDSDISRLARGQTAIEHCDPWVAQVLERCREVAAETDDWFSAYAVGRLDPSGWVKGWAIEQASHLLREAGSEHHCVSGGGDVQAVGQASPGRSWRIGIADPLHRDRIIAAITTRDTAMAVATSGIAERGAHIINPHTGQPATGLLSMTLIGSSIARTDAWATAAFAMGPTLGVQWAGKRAGVEALAVLHDGSIKCTPGITELIA